MVDVFLSYKREDKAKARAVAEALARRGLDVWWDVDLLPGDRFAEAIAAVVKQAKVAVVLWSQGSVASPWVRAESRLALDRGILVPVRLDGSAPPLPFNDVQTLDLTTWDGRADSDLLAPLVEAVAQRAGSSGQTVSPAETTDRLHGRDAEARLWASISARDPPPVDEYRLYLERYPNGLFADLAHLRIAEAKKPAPLAPMKSVAAATAVVALVAGIFGLIAKWPDVAEVLGLVTEEKTSAQGPSRPTDVVDGTARHTPPTVPAAVGPNGAEEERRPALEETRTWVVAPSGGDYNNPQEAVAAARPGDVIEVRPGVYFGGVIVATPVDIVGMGDQAEVVWEAEGESVVLWKAASGRLANLTLRLRGGDAFAVDFDGGAAVLEHCDLTSKGLASIAIRNRADPIIRRNRIHNTAQSGIYIYDDGKGRIENNEIFRNDIAGIWIERRADPIITGNSIRYGKQMGIAVYGESKGRIERNELIANAAPGISIAENSNPILIGNIIRDGRSMGIYVYNEGEGWIQDNQIFGNRLAGIGVRTGGNPTVIGNTIARNAHQGVRVWDGGRGSFTGNDLRGNQAGPWLIDKTSGTVKRVDNLEQ